MVFVVLNQVGGSLVYTLNVLASKKRNQIGIKVVGLQNAWPF